MKRTKIVLLILLSVIILVFAGCPKDEEPTPEPTPEPTTAPTALPTLAPGMVDQFTVTNGAKPIFTFTPISNQFSDFTKMVASVYVSSTYDGVTARSRLWGNYDSPTGWTNSVQGEYIMNNYIPSATVNVIVTTLDTWVKIEVSIPPAGEEFADYNTAYRPADTDTGPFNFASILEVPSGQNHELVYLIKDVMLSNDAEDVTCTADVFGSIGASWDEANITHAVVADPTL